MEYFEYYLTFDNIYIETKMNIIKMKIIKMKI